MSAAEPTQHDVVVIGGRCAGSATARLLAAHGHDVVVVERAALPSDTLSTHAIARGGVVQLSRWGLLDPVLAGTPAVRDVTFRVGDHEATGRIKDRAGVDLLVAPRRVVLDVEHALRLGACGLRGQVLVTATAGVLLSGSGIDLESVGELDVGLP
jgi:choline dehydrogenase-like flavoprotein